MSHDRAPSQATTATYDSAHPVMKTPGSAGGSRSAKRYAGVTPAVQKRSAQPESSNSDAAKDSIHDAAALGVSEGGAALPHLEVTQRAFGRHDISGVQAHVGGPASAACDEIGASAYAVGNHVAFKEAPDLHTTAHEAAHVVQQRGGVQLKGGVGVAGDMYEQHADSVADAVVAGNSAEGLLDELCGADAGGASPVASAVQKRNRPRRSGKNPLRGPATTPGATTWRETGNLFGNPPVRDEVNPPNTGIEEKESVYNMRRAAAEQVHQDQVVRAESMLNAGYGGLDNRYWFSKVYSWVTENELLEAANQTFYYPSFVMQSVRYFEQIYANNVAAADAGKAIEDHWASAFRTASDEAHDTADIWDGITLGMYQPILSLVESMKAHIRFDLPRAEAWVFNSYYAHMDNAQIDDFAADFNSMMGIFDRAGEKMNEEIDLHTLLPSNIMGRVLQDFAMDRWFDADMAMERADTWQRTKELVDSGNVGEDPYKDDGDKLTGDVTAGDNVSQLGRIPTKNLRPSMKESADIGSDSDIRDEVDGSSVASLAKKSCSERARMMRRLARGIVFDADELTILTLLEATRVAGDVATTCDAANAWYLLSPTNGDEYDRMRTFFRTHYYGQTSTSVAYTYVRRCIDGVTKEWEEEMIADILTDHPAGRKIITMIGAHYEAGGFKEGLMKLEWQLDGSDETRVTDKYGESGLDYGDTAIRDRVANMSAGELGKLPVDVRANMIKRLNQGVTGDEDEATMLDIMRASRGNGDLVAVIDRADAWTIAANVHGDEWTTCRAIFRNSYYKSTSINVAFKLIVHCMKGETVEWEEEMIADLLVMRSDGRQLITMIGQYYESGDFRAGLMKVEWQLDGKDQTRVENKFGESGIWFGDTAINERVNDSSGSELAAMGTREKGNMIKRLLQGITGDDDENTVLKLLRVSITKGDLVAVVNIPGAYKIAANLHGAEWTKCKPILRKHYYAQCNQDKAFSIVRTCMDGVTAEWEEEMIADIVVKRKSGDGKQLVTRIGRHYEDGGFKDGLNKLEWQLDGYDQERVTAAYGSSGKWW